MTAMAATFVPHYQLFGDPRAESTLLVLHGILGSGANWATFARRRVEADPAESVALVDLRMHGRSQGAPPPHDLDRCVEEIGPDRLHGFVWCVGSMPEEDALAADGDLVVSDHGMGATNRVQVLGMDGTPRTRRTERRSFRVGSSSGNRMVRSSI